MAVFRYFTIVLLALLNTVLAEDAKMTLTQIDKIGREKQRKIEALERNSRNGIIEFTVDQWDELVFKNPRPYDVVLLWNVRPGKCEHCQEASDEYESLVYSFINARGHQSGEQQNAGQEKKIFFGIYYFEKNKVTQKVFKDLGLLTVPYLTVSEMDLKREAKTETFFKPENKWLIGANEVHDAQKQIEFVNNSLRTDVKQSFTFTAILMKNIMLFIFVGLFYQLIVSIYDILLMQIVWFGIAIAAFIICTGGLIYSLINETPLFKFERNEYGSIVVAEYFMRGQRGQWRGEGYLVSTLVTFTGLLWLFLSKIEVVKQFKDQNKFTQRCIIYGIVMNLYLAQQMLVTAYKKKSSWYNPTFMPPSYYNTGSLMSDQGNNI